MTAIRTARDGGVGLLLVGLLGLGAAGCSGGSARTDYYASRTIVHTSGAGDGSVVAIAPGASDAAWTASLTFVPISDAGDLAADLPR